MDDDTKSVLAEARAKGLWFHKGYQDLWFSPDEMEAMWASGRFRWGAANWTLCDPNDRAAQLADKAAKAAKEYREFVARAGLMVTGSWGL